MTRARPADLDLSVSDVVVLGMVRLGARSGYEIKQAVEASIRFFWTISQVQIYPSLRRLEKYRLLRGRSEPRGNRPRRVYEITARGEDALRRWLEEDVPMPFELRDIGMLKLFFADVLDTPAAIRLLESIRLRSEARVAVLRGIEPQAEAAEAVGNPHPLLTLRMGTAFHEAMIKVCMDFEREFARA